jgi:hypothetical protein
VQAYQLTQRGLAGGLQWAGERRLFCGASLLDLDRRVLLCDQSAPPGALWPSGQSSPDGRLWLVRRFGDDEWAKIEKKLPPAAGPPTRLYLTAASLPEAVAGPLDAAARGFLWSPGVKVRVTVADSVPRAYRGRVAELCSDRLAGEGYRVDPAAPITAEVTLKLEGKSQGVGRTVPREELSDDQKWQLRLHPGMAWYEKTDVYGFSVQTRVLDGGRPALQSQRFGVSITLKIGSDEDAAWRKLTEQGIGLSLPRLYLRVAGHRRLTLPRSYRPGVDGLLEPAAEPAPGPVKDGFELPEDG